MPTGSNLQKALCFAVLLGAGAMTAASSETDPFEAAVRTGNLDGIGSHLDSADMVDIPGANGKTALMIAARAGKIDLVNRLLDSRANPNARTLTGGTPLMFAAISGSIPVLARLLDAGADVNATGSNGWSALMVVSAKGHDRATQLLLDAGADINAADIYLWTALHRAAYENRASVVRVLLRHQDVNLQGQDDHGATALHHAAAGGYREIVQMLIDAGADPRQADLSGRSPATYATQSGHPRLASVLGEEDR